MSDAPRWPGADGAPGLDFSRKPKDEAELPANEPGNMPPAKDMDAGAAAGAKIGGNADDGVDGPTTRNIERVPAGDAPAGGPAAARPQGERRSQSADEWELDSITRQQKPVGPGPAGPAGGAAAGAAAGAGAAKATSTFQPGPPKPGAAAASPAAPAARPARAADTPSKPPRPSRRTRKARLRIHRIDPWSVMKTSFLFSIAFGVMTVAAVGVLWSVFAGSDTMTYINDLVNSVIADPQGGKKFDIQEFLSWQRVLGLTTVLAAIDVVIFTAVATLFAFLYNLSAIIMGGLELTLAED